MTAKNVILQLKQKKHNLGLYDDLWLWRDIPNVSDCTSFQPGKKQLRAMKEKNLSLLFHCQPKLSIQEAKQQKIRNLNFDTVRSLDTGESKKCASTVSIWHPVIVHGAWWTNLRGRDGAMNSSSADLWQHWAWQSHKRKKLELLTQIPIISGVSLRVDFTIKLVTSFNIRQITWTQCCACHSKDNLDQFLTPDASSVPSQEPLLLPIKNIPLSYHLRIE